MPRVIRSVTISGGLALLFAMVLGNGLGAAAVAPDGPRLAFLRGGPPLPAEELLTIDPLGNNPSRIARASDRELFPSEGFSWSADGTRLGFGWFFSVPGLRPAIHTLPINGGRATAVRGTKGGFNPVFSPDGETLAFSRLRFRKRQGRRPYFAISIWLVDAQGGRSRRLTLERDGVFLTPSSFAPDGTRLAAVRKERGEPPAVVSVSLADGRSSLVFEDGTEPTYSPDGSTIAFVRWGRARPKPGPWRSLRGGDLFLVDADGSNVRRLTRDPTKGESGPSWDPSGERLAYTQRPPSGALAEIFGGPGSAIAEINADGTCEHRLLFTHGLSYWGAAWQPGPGRDAGRIEC